MDYALIDRTIVTLYGKPQQDQLTPDNQTSSIQDEVLYGMPVKILEQVQEGWVKVQTYYRYQGYAALTGLRLLTDQKWEAWQQAKPTLRVIRGSYVDVLACPKVQGVRLAALTRGALVQWIEDVKEPAGWAKVRLNNGQEGYVKQSTLAGYYDRPCCEREYDFRQKLVETAKLYLGTQYRWGGKSPLGIDCSGLTSMTYLMNGVIIYRDAKIKEGFPIYEIPFATKKPGDLLYFPGHIALYMGNNYFIHATAHPGSDGVVINSLNPSDDSYRPDLAQSLYAVGSLF